jgi:hypothetical protein
MQTTHQGSSSNCSIPITSSILAFCILFTGCSNAKDEEVMQQLQQQVTKLTQENEGLKNETATKAVAKEKTNDGFDKKQECQKLIAGLEKYLKEASASLGDILTLDKVFYSERENSCLYAVNIITDHGNAYGLYDALTHSMLEIVWPKGTKEEQDAAVSKFLGVLNGYGY